MLRVNGLQSCMIQIEIIKLTPPRRGGGEKIQKNNKKRKKKRDNKKQTQLHFIFAKKITASRPEYQIQNTKLKIQN